MQCGDSSKTTQSLSGSVMGNPSAPKGTDTGAWVRDGNSTLSIPGRIRLELYEFGAGHPLKFGMQVKRTQRTEHLGNHGEVALWRIEMQSNFVIAYVVVVSSEAWNEHLAGYASAHADHVTSESIDDRTGSDERGSNAWPARCDAPIGADARRSSRVPCLPCFNFQSAGDVLGPKAIQGDVTTLAQLVSRRRVDRKRSPATVDFRMFRLCQYVRHHALLDENDTVGLRPGAR
jgi:hypothetical protein